MSKKEKKRRAKEGGEEIKQKEGENDRETENEPPQEITFSVFDIIKVKVETTKDFPLDLKCTVMFTDNDLEEFARIQQEQKEARGKPLLAGHEHESRVEI